MKIVMQEPTRPEFVGRPKRMESYERTSSIRPAGVLATACTQWGPCATREVPAVIAVWINWQLARDTVSGGVILTNATNLPADETSIYGTAGNASNIGVSLGTGFTNPLVVTFPVPISNFFLDVLNGNIIPVAYDLSDNAGNSASFNLAPNLNGGLKTVGFAAAGTVVDITAATGQTTATGMTWDFFIDNIHFDEPLPTQTPEPSALAMLGLGLGSLILTSKWLGSRR